MKTKRKIDLKMKRKQPSGNSCLVHPFEPRQLFCFSCKYFYCQICCEAGRHHKGHSDTIIHIPLENFEFERYLGSGKFACVFRVIDFENGHGYAVKIISNVNKKWEIERLLFKPSFTLRYRTRTS